MIAKAENTPLEKVRVLQRTLYLAAKAIRSVNSECFTTRFAGKISASAYTQVRANGGAPGLDHLAFDSSRAKLEWTFPERSGETRCEAISASACPTGLYPKADGMKSPLGIPVIVDRVVQAAVKIVIEPLFEAVFKDFSYGFRPRKSAHHALREVYKWLNFGCTGLSMRISSRTSTEST